MAAYGGRSAKHTVLEIEANKHVCNHACHDSRDAPGDPTALGAISIVSKKP